MSRYIYQRTGGPLLVWGPGRPPSQARAADAKSLGDWAPILPGAPERIGDLSAVRGIAPWVAPVVTGAVVHMAGGGALAVAGGAAAGALLKPWVAGAVTGAIADGSKGALIGLAAGIAWTVLLG